jgi:hypothetical protein
MDDLRTIREVLEEFAEDGPRQGITVALEALARLEAREAEMAGTIDLISAIQKKIGLQVAGDKAFFDRAEIGAMIGQYAYRYSEGMRLDNAKYARVLQNMVEEAEENLANLAEKMRGYENLEHLNERRGELREAMALVATLDPEHYKMPEEK